MIFYLGILVMILNEGFVILRHVSPYLAQKREQLIQKFGSKWKLFHSIMDITWVSLVAIGFYLDLENWKVNLTVFGTIWGIVLIYYIPVLYKKFKRK